MIRCLAVVGALVLALVCGPATARAEQVGDAFIVFNVDTGDLHMNPGNAGVSHGNGIGSYVIRPDPAVIQFSSNATQFSYPSGSYLFPPTLGNVTIGDDNTIGAAFYTLGSPNVNAAAAYLDSSNLVTASAAVGGTSGSISWGPGSGGVVASAIPGGYFGTNEWSFGTIGTTGMTLSEALAAFGTASQGGFSNSADMVYDIDGVTGEQSFRVYTVSVVPEPSTISLMALFGFAMAAGCLRRQRRRSMRWHRMSRS